MILTSNITLVGVAGVCCNVTGYGYNRIQFDTDSGIVSLNLVAYIESGDFTTGAAFNIGTIDSTDCRPGGTVSIAGSDIFVANYYDINGAAFGGTCNYDKYNIQILTDGTINVHIEAITDYATISATDYVILPINVHFIRPTELIIAVLP